MPDGSRFVQNKSLFQNVLDLLSMVFDVVTAVALAIPLVFKAIYRLVYHKRKNIGGQLALVTGGGNGLGQSICLKLASEGCNVAVVDVDLKAAEKTAEMARERGVKAKAYKADVTKADEIIELRSVSLNDLGSVDILVNNAGLMSNKNMDEKADVMELMVKVNVLGPMLVTKYFLEQMKERASGHIVCISSMSGMHATPFSIPYSATKFGVHGFMSALTEHLRLEKLRSKIKTTCVFPYYIKTRQDVIDFLNPNIRFPPLETDETAHEVVEAILREDHNVTVPLHFKPLMKFLNIFPLSVHELSRDRVMKEFEFSDPSWHLEHIKVLRFLERIVLNSKGNTTSGFNDQKTLMK